MLPTYGNPTPTPVPPSPPTPSPIGNQDDAIIYDIKLFQDQGSGEVDCTATRTISNQRSFRITGSYRPSNNTFLPIGPTVPGLPPLSLANTTGNGVFNCVIATTGLNFYCGPFYFSFHVLDSGMNVLCAVRFKVILQ